MDWICVLITFCRYSIPAMGVYGITGNFGGVVFQPRLVRRLGPQIRAKFTTNAMSPRIRDMWMKRHVDTHTILVRVHIVRVKEWIYSVVNWKIFIFFLDVLGKMPPLHHRILCTESPLCSDHSPICPGLSDPLFWGRHTFCLDRWIHPDPGSPLEPTLGASSPRHHSSSCHRTGFFSHLGRSRLVKQATWFLM